MNSDSSAGALLLLADASTDPHRSRVCSLSCLVIYFRVSGSCMRVRFRRVCGGDIVQAPALSAEAALH